MKKIAVFLPECQKGEMFREAKNIAKSIAYQAKEKNENIQVVFSCLKDKYNLKVDFEDLFEMGITVRETKWIAYSVEKIRKLDMILNRIDSVDSSNYTIPTDNNHDFFDCDLWIVVTDRLDAPLYPMRRYICIQYDYIQRYVPEIFPNTDEAWDFNLKTLFHTVRNAEKVFVTTPFTKDDIVSYAGVSKRKVELLPINFEPLILKNKNSKRSSEVLKDYFIWVTNSTRHKNHINALYALKKYYEEYNGKLKVIITGCGTKWFDPKQDESLEGLSQSDKDYINKVRDIIENSPELLDNIIFKYYISDNGYVDVLEKSRFLWHTNVTDNGTFSVIEAAYLGVPSLSSQYPPMEFINNQFKLNMKFFNPHDINNMSQALKTMETAYCEIILPDRSSLEKYTWKNNSAVLYNKIKDILETI